VNGAQKAAIWPAGKPAGGGVDICQGVPLSPNWLQPISTDEMIACLGSRQDRSGLAAIIADLSLRPSLNTPVEIRRLEAARAAMVDWKAYSAACQARHNAHRQRLSRR
jgi:hypothetical protein